MKIRNFILVLVIIGGLLTVTVIKLLNNKKSVEEKVYIPDLSTPVLVDVVGPTIRTFSDEFSYLGTFDPFRQNIIGAEAGGKVITVTFSEGDRVGQGSLLAKLDDENIRLQMEALAVAVEGQVQDDNRIGILTEQQVVPAMQAEKTKLALKSSMVQRKQLEKQLRSTAIHAPFPGVITKKLIDLGSFVGPGTPVAEITDISNLKLTINVPERDINKFKVNQAITVKLDDSDTDIPGKVRNIGIQGDKSHNFKVQIEIKNTDLKIKAGMYGTGVLRNESKVTALAIPRKALVGSLKNPQVYVVRGGKARLISIGVGLVEDGYIEVREGLTEKDKVVVKGQINLKDNQNIKIDKK